MERAEAKCSVCGKEGATLRCAGCHVTHYCSKACQKADWTSSHKWRCPIAQYPDVRAATLLSDDAEHALLAARAVAPGELVFAEMPVLAAPLEPQKRLLDGQAKHTRDEEARSAEARYEGLLMRNLLTMHSENVIPLEQMVLVPPGTVTTWTLVNLLACYLAAAAAAAANTKNKARASVVCDAVDALVPPAAGSGATSSRWEILRGLAADVAKLPQVGDVLEGDLRGAATLVERVEQLLARLDCRHVVCREGPLAAVYARACFMRHSCAPNAVYTTRRDGALFVRAVRPIAPGEQITVSFLDDMQMLWPTKRRRECLLELKYFVCRCPRCEQPDRACAVRCPRCGAEACMPTGLLLEPLPEELPEEQRRAALQRAAASDCWHCQACHERFSSVQEPFCAEQELLLGALHVEQKLEQRAPAKSGEADALLAEIDALLRRCHEKLGQRHWAVAQLEYARMIELQAQAVRAKDDAERARAQKEAAESARRFFEWVDATLHNDCLSLVANTGYVTAQMCQRCPELEDYATEVLARIYPLYAAVHGSENADTKLIADSLKAKSPQQKQEQQQA